MSTDEIENADLLFDDLEFDPQLDVFWDVLNNAEGSNLIIPPQNIEYVDPGANFPAPELQSSLRYA